MTKSLRLPPKSSGEKGILWNGALFGGLPGTNEGARYFRATFLRFRLRRKAASPETPNTRAKPPIVPPMISPSSALEIPEVGLVDGDAETEEELEEVELDVIEELDVVEEVVGELE